jgi:para-nitrobenzyl esterase
MLESLLRRGGAISLSLCMLLLAGSSAAQPRVRVHQGILEGSATAGVIVFKGIPFAAAPIGDLRWRPPQPPADWTGVRQAVSFPPACKQDLVRSQLPWTEEFMPQSSDSEDCLYLNVWTPNPKPTHPLPVYVFIHGGAFHQGATSIAVYGGAPLAAHGIVVVTVQYRLGVFGFLAHPALSEESPHHASGNYALLDCLAALQWLRENVAAFGGDPTHITIGGQSAGANAVHDLLASPLAAGLISGAIAESGSSIGPPLKSLASAEREGEAFAKAHGATSLADLRALPAEALLPTSTGPSRFGPIVDGWSLPEDPMAAIAAGHSMDVPILTGMQADEGSSSPTYGHLSAAKSSLPTGAFKLYGFTDDSSSGSAVKSCARDRGIASMFLWASLTAGHNHAPVYTYYWAHAIPWPEHPEFGAFHSSELPYVFDNLKVLPRPFTAEDHALATQASAMWANFIRTGNPNGPGLARWQPVDPAKPETFQIDINPHMRPLMTSDRLSFWTSALVGQTPGGAK